MVNAAHHPPKGAFPQSADNLVCNTMKIEKEKTRGSGKRKSDSIRHVDKGRETLC